jgi:hypothetical protein
MFRRGEANGRNGRDLGLRTDPLMHGQLLCAAFTIGDAGVDH